MKAFVTERKQRLVFLVIAAVLIVISIGSLNYAAMSKVSWGNVGEVFRGLLAVNWHFVYDGSGEDLVSLLGMTICIAFVGTTIGGLVAVPLGFLSARNSWHTKIPISGLFKVVCDSLRAFPELVYAIIFVKVVGPGAFAGVLAIGIHQIGMLGKLYGETIEEMDESAVESIKTTGARPLQVLVHARLPQVLPTFTSFWLNHFEIGVRSAATLGLVGAGGIGAPMIFAIQSRDWSKVGIILLGVMVTVFLIDAGAGYLRKKLQ